jgi:subtilisin family serine protease
LNIVTRQVFDDTMNGFVAHLDRSQLAQVRQLPGVERVEENGIVHANVEWNLDRIDQNNLPLSDGYLTNSQGSGVTAYVVDTGIDTDHPDFEGRAANVFDATGGSGEDCNGHGTHIAGIIGGEEYGVAKNAQLRGVRVLDCQGSGTTSDVIAGLDWIAANADHPAVTNLSFGGNFSRSLNDAATSLADSGVYVTVAAGNSGSDACEESPASADRVLTVAASNRHDRVASFSNDGPCVELYAPGVDVRSTWPDNRIATLSGTSTAAPHAAGVAALYKSAKGDAEADTITTWLRQNASADVLKRVPANTPNLLLYTNGL